jgi:hypothetical protein
MKWLPIAALGVLFCAPSFGQSTSAIEVTGPTWEKGVTEVTLKSRFRAQESGAFAETVVKARCEGILQEVIAADGRRATVFRNALGTIVGFNFKPAVEVNVIYLVTKTANEQLHVYENLSSLLIGQVAPFQQGFKPEDSGYFFLTNVRAQRITIEYRGEKKLKPRIHPFSVDLEVQPNGELKLQPESIKQF